MAAFTVYLDADEVKPLPKPQPLSRQPTLVDTLDSSEAGPSTVSATEKENLHPTGGRMTSSNALGAKRKSSVLVTKLHNPPNATKKRKLASSDSSESVSKSCKVKRSTTRTQKAPELPSVEEEVKDKDEKLARTLSQSQIDSRCYDLTVSPLANVSEAFGSPSPTSTPSKPQRVSKSVSKAGSVEPEIRDYVVSPADVSFPSPPPKVRTRDMSLPPPILSTPERKRIYASFTFSSPVKPLPSRRNPSSSAVKISDAPFAF